MNIRPNAFLRRRAIAIFTLVAMLLAPLCASICGSRVCASLSSTQSEDCHGSLAANNAVPQTAVAAVRVCGLQEFPAAALNEKSNPPERIKQASAVHASSNLVPSQSVQLPFSGGSYLRADDESRMTNASVQPTILRI